MKLLPILFVASVAAGAASLPVRPVFVTGNSMEPTLQNHQLLLGSRDLTNLKRGDVVVAETPVGTSIKRILYLEGDSFPQFFWNNEWVIPHSDRVRATMERLKYPKRIVEIPRGQMFLVGDNRLASTDSRNYGALPLSAVRLRIDNVPDAGSPAPGTHYAGIKRKTAGTS